MPRKKKFLKKYTKVFRVLVFIQSKSLYLSQVKRTFAAIMVTVKTSGIT
jgi:hypothetical protein